MNSFSLFIVLGLYLEFQKTAKFDPIEYISKEELVEAMLVIARVCIGTTPDSLFRETARAYGYNRTGAKIQNSLRLAYDELLASGKAKETDGKGCCNLISFLLLHSRLSNDC